MPNITIDGLTIADSTASDTKFFILPDYNPEFTGCNTKYPYKTIKTLRLKNVRCESGNPIEICDNPLLYKDLTLIEE